MSEAVENAAEIVQYDEAPQVSPVANMLQAIERAAVNPEVDVEKMERLMAMAERMQDRSAEQEFNRAMAAAQIEIGRIPQDKLNKGVKGDPAAYASYAQIDRIVRPIYAKHGFALSFGTRPAGDEEVCVTCRLSHIEGHSEHYEIAMPADGKGAKGGDVMTKTHATGSATTYGKRYLIILIFNLAIGSDPDDDDGNSASGLGYTPITEEQALAIDAFIKENELDMNAFIGMLKRVFKVSSISEIGEHQHDNVWRALKKKAA